MTWIDLIYKLFWGCEQKYIVTTRYACTLFYNLPVGRVVLYIYWKYCDLLIIIDLCNLHNCLFWNYFCNVQLTIKLLFLLNNN